MSTPQGIAHNNPMNIKASSINWAGQTDVSGKFCVFATPSAGIRAVARDLLVKNKKDHLTTIRQIVSRYAPPNENNTAAYINFVAKQMAIGPDELLDLSIPGQLLAMTLAIIRYESGQQPYPMQLVAAAVQDAAALPIA